MKDSLKKEAAVSLCQDWIPETVYQVRYLKAVFYKLWQELPPYSVFPSISCQLTTRHISLQKTEIPQWINVDIQAESSRNWLKHGSKLCRMATFANVSLNVYFVEDRSLIPKSLWHCMQFLCTIKPTGANQAFISTSSHLKAHSQVKLQDYNGSQLLVTINSFLSIRYLHCIFYTG